MSSSSSVGPASAVPAGDRCPDCGSRVRAEETWCSLCHRSLVTNVAFTAAPELAAEPGSGSAPESGSGLESGSARDAKNGPDGTAGERPVDPAVAATADRLLAELAAAEAERARESGLTALQARFGSRGGLVLAVGGGILLLVVGFLGLTLLGLLV